MSFENSSGSFCGNVCSCSRAYHFILPNSYIHSDVDLVENSVKATRKKPVIDHCYGFIQFCTLDKHSLLAPILGNLSKSIYTTRLLNSGISPERSPFTLFSRIGKRLPTEP